MFEKMYENVWLKKVIKYLSCHFDFQQVEVLVVIITDPKQEKFSLISCQPEEIKAMCLFRQCMYFPMSSNTKRDIHSIPNTTWHFISIEPEAISKHTVPYSGSKGI